MKIFKFILLIILIFNTIKVYCQKWEWSRHISSADDVYIRGLTIDNNNVYLAGEFLNTADIGAPAELVSTNLNDIYIVKYDNDNNYLWHNQFYGAGEDFAGDITINNDNILISGYYNQELTIGLEVLPVYVNNKSDVFITKYQSNGNFLWAKQIAYGPGDIDTRGGLSVDNAGNIYVTGRSTDTIFFSNDTLITYSGRTHNFIAKFNSNGDFIWATQIRGSSTFFKRNLFRELVVTNSNEIYLGGFFEDSLYVGEYKLKGRGTREDIILVKLNSSGNVQWVRQAGSVNALDRCNGVSTDKYGNVYITGYITGTALFDSTGTGLFNSSPISTNGSFDIMVAKYNKNGTLLWKRNNGDVGADIGYGAYIFENIVQFSGYFSGEVIFNQDTLRSLNTSDNNTGFFVYDTEGNPVTAQAISGNGDDRGEEILYDDRGNTYIAGYFKSDTLYIGNENLINASTTGTIDAFLAKYQHKFSLALSNQKYVTCYGGNDGELTVTPYFGVAPYNYIWSGNVTDFDNSHAYNLTAGTYSVTVTDSRDSTATLVSIVITEPMPVVTTIDSTDLTCYLSNDGVIDLEVTGGTIAGDYNYNWTGGTGLDPSSQDQAGIAAGFYKVTVTDDNDCKAYDSIIVLQPDPIKILVVNVDSANPAGTGAIDLDIEGGTPNYTFIWEKDGVAMAGRINDTLNNLSGALYSVTVSDDKSCKKDTNIVVPQDNVLIAYMESLIHVSCENANNGYARVVVSDDQGNDYSYSWQNEERTSIGLNENSVDDLSGGKYYVTVSENGGLSRVDSTFFTILEPDSIKTQILFFNPVCFNELTGVINVVVSGGTKPYNYLWSTGQTTEDLSLIPGSNEYYKVKVTDANNCEVVDSVLLTDPNQIVANITEIQDILCNGYLTGILRVIATGGDGTLDYLWDDPGTQTSNIATGLEANTYQVKVTDDKGCSSIANYELTDPVPLIITQIDTSSITCRGAGDGYISITVEGGTDPYTYNWTPFGGDTNIIESLGPFPYTVLITDVNDCPSLEFSFTVKQPDIILEINELFTEHRDLNCFNDNSGSFEVLTTGGWGINEYSLNGIDWLDSPIFTDMNAGVLDVRVRDAGNCIKNTYVLLVQPDEIIVQTPVVNGNTIIITAYGGTGQLNYSLNDGTPQVSGTFSDLPDGEYTISVIDGNGCSVDVTAVVDIEALYKITIYDAFSPNADGKNDVWNIGNIEIFPNCIINVYNSWGTKVFNSNGYAEPWDGTYNGKELPSGTYYYVIDLGDDFDSYSGTVNIVK